MYNFKNKKANLIQANNYMFAKTLSMFEYEGLPDSIPYVELEKLLQQNGYAFITEFNGTLYAFNGGLGGEPDVYGNPTQIIISNPALNFNKTLNLETDGVLIKNDDLKIGLTPLYDRYNSFLVENDINMTLYGYNSRLQTMISAPDDKSKTSADKYLKDIIDGEMGIIGENAMFDGIRTHSNSTSNNSGVTQLVEYHQYIKASLYNEIGLSANFNMKRERLTSSEVEQGESSLFPFVYNMMKCRLKAIEKINEKYGLDIEIDFGSVWGDKNRDVVDDKVETVLTTDEPTDEPPHEPTDEPPHEPTDEPPHEPLTESTETKADKLPEDIEEIIEILEDESLSEEERLQWNILLEELQDEQNKQTI